MADKYDAILDAALEAFSRRGYDGTGLREIAKIAKVAQPTINYHFKSKEQLFSAVIQRGVKATTITRVAKLELLLGKGGVPELEDIVRVLFEPYNSPEKEVPAHEAQFNKFVAQFGLGNEAYSLSVTFEAFDNMAVHFIDAILLTDNGFDRLSAAKAYLYALPVGMYAIAHKNRLPGLAGLSVSASEVQFSFDDVIFFICAGMRAIAAKRAASA
ncbi:helix-turn-helix domain containing protein [Sulfitobacter sp. F26204]|uniref:helix-turn-helix domain-containing protein n=1 Tax=Sulfitobacter sp. F26204 TaxID=2996014 RepID=UPI00225E1CEF|nr:TetR/AcrR family transcriptional regulator [Sulfitobacter sp. F26204]MCX7560939.1 helix-turn-helix domain containing protein [Sulfitobacter sp. F26204]